MSYLEMMLYSHAKCVEKDGHQNTAMNDVALNKFLQKHLELLHDSCSKDM